MTKALSDQIMFNDVEFPKSFRDELWFCNEMVGSKPFEAAVRGTVASISFSMKDATYKLDDGRFVNVVRDGKKMQARDYRIPKFAVLNK